MLISNKESCPQCKWVISKPNNTNVFISNNHVADKKWATSAAIQKKKVSIQKKSRTLLPSCAVREALPGCWEWGGAGSRDLPVPPSHSRWRSRPATRHIAHGCATLHRTATTAAESSVEPYGIFRQCCGSGSVRIHIIFQDADEFPGCLGSGSGSTSYSQGQNKINWKGELNKEYLLCGSCWTYWQGKWSKDIGIKSRYCFRYIHYLFETVRTRIRIKQPDPDPYQIGKQDPDPYQSEKQDPDPDPYQKGLHPQHCLPH